eukprot:INCI4992.6.p1 GENE.INCI4992.6~~INCI4992.6.p1  ORF type:complete len:295 (+),score=36.05 INCI4992.6:732-1616(+)
MNGLNSIDTCRRHLIQHKGQRQRRPELLQIMRKLVNFNCTTAPECHELAQAYMNILEDAELGDAAFLRAADLAPFDPVYVVTAYKRQQEQGDFLRFREKYLPVANNYRLWMCCRLPHWGLTNNENSSDCGDVECPSTKSISEGANATRDFSFIAPETRTAVPNRKLGPNAFRRLKQLRERLRLTAIKDSGVCRRVHKALAQSSRLSGALYMLLGDPATEPIIAQMASVAKDVDYQSVLSGSWNLTKAKTTFPVHVATLLASLCSVKPELWSPDLLPPLNQSKSDPQKLPAPAGP